MDNLGLDGCGMWDVDVGCGMWDVGCGMWDVGCGMWDVDVDVDVRCGFAAFGSVGYLLYIVASYHLRRVGDMGRLWLG